LINVDGLSNLTSVEGILGFSSNDILPNIDGVSNISSNIESLYVVSNDSLKNINGLSGLVTIENSIDILSNRTLENIDSLINVTVIGERLYILGNDSLTTLIGLFSVTSIGSHVQIATNYALYDCCGIQNLLSNPNSIGGVIQIFNNRLDCDSEEEIIDAICSTNINNDFSALEWNLVPNVATAGNAIFIESDMNINQAQIEIRSVNGQVILSQGYSVGDIQIPEYISMGLYFISIQLDGNISTKRIFIR